MPSPTNASGGGRGGRGGGRGLTGSLHGDGKAGEGSWREEEAGCYCNSTTFLPRRDCKHDDDDNVGRGEEKERKNNSCPKRCGWRGMMTMAKTLLLVSCLGNWGGGGATERWTRLRLESWQYSTVYPTLHSEGGRTKKKEKETVCGCGGGERKWGKQFLLPAGGK